MKILFIQKEGGIFGAEQFQLKIIPALLQRGVQIEFLRLYTSFQLGINSPFVGKLKEFGIPVHQVNIGRFPGIGDILKIKSIIKKGDFDIVHTHLIHADLYGALIKSFFFKEMILVSTKHGYDEDYTTRFGLDPAQLKKNLYYRLSHFSESIVNKSFAISDGLRNFFVGAGISKATTLGRIHYGFDMNIETDYSEAPAYRHASPQLVLAGRLVNFKGHRFALEAISILKAKYPSLRLLIIGVGGMEEELRRKTTEMGLDDHVSFLGFKSDVKNFMHHSDVVLIPSIAEGFGVVFLEAISQSRPIAAFNVAAGNEIFDESYLPLLAKPFDVSDYANKIDRLLSDAESWRVPLQKSKDRLMTYFTMKRMTDEMIDFYNRVLN